MSLFPYNFNKHNEPEGREFWSFKWQGSPIDFHKALELADKIFHWHSGNNTSDWTQSNDGADEDKRRIALGLMTLLAEPSIVKMIGAVGEHTEQALGVILDNIKLGYINKNQISLLKNLNIWQKCWDEYLEEGKKKRSENGKKPKR